ncbi:DUF4199 domain-containing protein [Salinimicrobium tongyeongense]|jgi:hypothetical protein|uniref:DUF4199 domain-containing protein n=1 Tax=Salinimicrobium tongyeongense TaxID=2809707 RepID=A0ABY6NNQ9_9FLAO|nr:DUF4199 domain-containing protein [Salinimicrobium tongyeongense]UZH54529.1 DUF4199 domain-containing protein [Salinimicrobium tongyeongense]
METQQATARKFVLNYGLLLGVALVVLGVIMYVTNNHIAPHWSFSIVTLALLIAFMVYGIKAFKTENAGFLSLGEAIKVAVGIGLIAAIIGGVWSILLSTVIEPDYMLQMSEMQREQMVEQFPNMTDAQIDDALEMSATFQSPWIIFASGLVLYMLGGLIIGLIAGLIMKENRPYEV